MHKYSLYDSSLGSGGGGGGCADFQLVAVSLYPAGKSGLLPGSPYP